MSLKKFQNFIKIKLLKETKMEKGNLYLIATPIGNMNDITPRAVEILDSVSLIAAEDTRVTGNLLKKLNIKKPLISYYEHNSAMREEKLINTLLEGNDVAVVSDAGTPAISDPGEYIVKACIENGIEVFPIPGPCAFVCALIVSGFSTDKFSFVGFLPSKDSQRETELKKYCDRKETLVFYEAPHRLLKTLTSMKNIFGDERNVCVSREITKKFEEHKRFNLSDACEYYENNSIKGEFVIVVEGNKNEDIKEVCFNSLEEHLRYYTDAGFSKNEAIKMVAKDKNVSKRDIYDYFKKD